VPHIIRVDSVSSTNSILKQLVADGAKEGTVVVAKQQTAGRGRAERQWHSPLGGLYFSLMVRPPPMRRPTDLALLTGAAMAQTVKRFFSPEIPVGVKWPNDVLIQGKKVGGVLCEALGTGKTTEIIIGVGININTPASELTAFSHIPFQASSFCEVSSGKHFDLEEVLQTFLAIFFEIYETYLQDGFRFVQNLWERECLLLGKKIELNENDSKIQGTFLGIDGQGALVISTPDGNRRSFVTGEITCCWY
jgi:BirA family biotin operon repressor/biotin-[acetyl-CoA-carboxylase] ligase